MTGGVYIFTIDARVRTTANPSKQTKASSSHRYFQQKNIKNIFDKKLKSKYLVINNITFLGLPFSRLVQFRFQYQKATINVHISLEHLRSIRRHHISNPNPTSNRIHLDFYIPCVLIYPLEDLLFFPHLLTSG